MVQDTINGQNIFNDTSTREQHYNYNTEFTEGGELQLR